MGAVERPAHSRTSDHGWKGLMAGALLAALLMACSQGTRNDVVRIYSSIPLQGASGADNRTIVDAMRMALEEHNSRAGPFKVEYISLDDSTAKRGKWDAAQETANARRAAADPAAVAYMGTVNSGAAKVSIPILNRVQLAMLSFANTYPGLTKTSGALASEPYAYYPLGPESRNYCRVLPADDLQGADGALYVQKNLQLKSVYVLDDTELYGHGIARIFTDKAREIGLQVLGGPDGIDGRNTPDAQKSRADIAATVAKAKPDLVYFGGATENHPAELLKDLRQAGFRGPFMGPDGIDEKAFIDEAGSSAGTVYATLPGLPAEQLKGPGAAWYQRWKARFGQEPAQYTQYGYEAMNVMLDAIARAGKRNRTLVLAALRATSNVQGILGTWKFDANCDTDQKTISVNVLQNGKFTYKELAPAQ